jgi:hypothetical protein
MTRAGWVVDGVEEIAMTTSTLGIVVIVIVVAAGLVVWISAVFRTEKHPETGRGGAPGRKVTGGIFRGDARQQMPRRDAPAEAMSKDPESGTGD